MNFHASFPNLMHTRQSELTLPLLTPRGLRREFSFSESDVGRIEASLAATPLSDADALQLSGADAAKLLQQAARLLDAEYAEAMQVLAADQREVVLTIQTLLEQGPQAAAGRALAGTAARKLALQTQACLDALHPAPQTERERSLGVLDFLGKMINNGFEQDHARWAGNVAHVAMRTGLVVALTTVLRQLIGFEIERALYLGDAPLPGREIIGLASMLLGSGLNLAGALRDEIRGTATWQSRLSRGTMAALSAGTLLLAMQLGNPSVLSSLMSSFGVQTASYTLMRDLIQLFLPLYSNAGINLAGTAAAGASYSTAQFLAGEAMDRFAPSSGAGRAMAAASAAESNAARMARWFGDGLDSSSALHGAALSQQAITAQVRSALKEVEPDLAQDMTRGIINAVAEMSDDLVLGGVSRASQVKQTKAAVHAQAQRDGRDPDAAVAALPRTDTEGLRIRLGARMPTATQAADQFLTIGAMRTSAFETIVGLAMCASTGLQYTGLSAASQAHAINAVVAGAAALIYQPFVYANRQGAPARKAVADALPATGLRRRRVSKAGQSV